MSKLLSILWNSFRMALQELKVNKLRTFLSLFGITIGIFCIIGVLTTVNSLENKVQSDIKSLGSNTIYIDKWSYSGGPDYPWWKYVNRPTPKYEEVKFLKERSPLSQNIAFFASSGAAVHFGENEISNVNVYGVSEEFNSIQTIEIAYGRYISESEFLRGNTAAIIGFEVASQLFGEAERAVGQTVVYDQKRVNVVGVIKKQGQSFIGGFDYDNCLIFSYRYFASVYDMSSGSTNPFIMVQGKPKVSTLTLMQELRGAMRQIRKISPLKEDDFSLNDVNAFSDQVSSFFGTVNIGGWVIAALSLIVGAFGVANIMFVTVRERTSQIGLKKAIGAKRSTILTEFLLESAFLCILGGTIGVLLVWGLSLVASAMLPFAITLAPNIIILAFVLCVALGVLSGIIPAYTASKLDPVVAIRST